MNQAFYFRVLRESLTTKLPTLQPYMYKTLVKGMEDHLTHKAEDKGDLKYPTDIVQETDDMCNPGWKSIHHYPFMEYVTMSTIGPIFGVLRCVRSPPGPA
jgi:hypothetical protein